jgi:hypothetical protein
MRSVLRRFGRIFFLLAAGVSLLLCVAAVVAWPVSYWRGFAVARHAGAFYRTFTISRGHFLLQAFGSIASDVNPPGVTWWETAASAPGELRYIAIGQPIDFRAQTWTFPRSLAPDADFFFYRRYRVGPNGYPLWWIVIVTALLPLLGGVSLRRRRAERRRLLVGHCPGCGYDCRATPGRCSECGWGFAGQNAD